ncbi:bacillithiol biosynthesis deacetylase BshB1 [Chlorobium sp. N1]|uniref:bacillithiol biosynthesis deacetylase BshB1 n=1 Tax=Chlorobium sp. N1 TaxID=2491138 RepID=UPI00103EE9C0|nr:bacillithiol biosynthesis deacetylase BshB1 [Chlorobium sp. N1]TCD48590.1 bacillithiol biosynthesis deacetylase BshB1 [Chlorobium sp. N1]
MQIESDGRGVYALAFGAHPDDVELSCGATLLNIIGEGRQVAVCDLTRGEMGTLGTPESRRREAEAAARAMGYLERVQLDLGDSKLFYTEENLHAVVSVIRRFRPAALFCNPPDERHPDHVKASKLVSDACYYAGLRQLKTTFEGKEQEAHRPRHLFHYIQYRDLPPDMIVDVSRTFEASRRGVLAFASQFWQEGDPDAPATMIKRKEFLSGLEARARALGEQIGALYGEGFLLSAVPAVHSFTACFPDH